MAGGGGGGDGAGGEEGGRGILGWEAAKRGGRGPSRRRPAAIYEKEELCALLTFS